MARLALRMLLLLVMLGLSQSFAASPVRSVIPSIAKVPLESSSSNDILQPVSSSALPSSKPTPDLKGNTIAKTEDTTFHGKKKKKKLPPVAIEGLFDDVIRSRRGPRSPQSYPTVLLAPPQTSHWKGGVRSFFRERRSLSPAGRFFDATSQRNKRDLRRLRRDLAYQFGGMPQHTRVPQYTRISQYLPKDLNFEGKSYDTDNLPPQVQAQMEPSEGLYEELAREREMEAKKKLNRLIQDLQILDQLSYMTQMNQPDDGSEYPPPSMRRGYASTATRFAPQPKLFPDSADNTPRGRVEEAIPMDWDDDESEPQINNKKRMSSQRLGLGMSRLPGMKRASPAFMHKASSMRGGQNDVMSLATMLGAELDPQSRRMRRTAM